MSTSKRWRVNHWSPWGRDASGITNYAALLVPELDRHFDLTVVHPNSNEPFFRTLKPRDIVWPTLDDADINLFHMGNHLEFHNWMVGPILKHGGIVVLHDWSLFDLMRPLFFRSAHLWDREMRHNNEDPLTMLEKQGQPGFRMAHPMNRRIIDAADVVIVHTPWLRDHARETFPDADIRYVPLAGPSLQPVAMSPDAAITVLGGIGGHKKVDVAITAFAAVAPLYPAAKFRIVGRGDDRREIARLRELADELGIGPRVEWHLNVDRESYLSLLNDSLFVITLRGETAGEMSAVLVEAWGAGRVAVTSDQPQFRSFPEDLCRRISLSERAPDELAAIMREALDAPELFEKAGAAGRALVEEHYTFASVGTQIANIVDEVATRISIDVASGVNYFGSFGTPSGLVEGARRLGHCLLDAEIPLTMPYGVRLPNYDVHAVPTRFALVAKDRRFAINLLSANINEFHKVGPEILGTDDGHRWNIGMWIYEFPEIPDILRARFKLVDEIWAGSDFAADVFRKYFDGPIMTLPYVVEPRVQTMTLEESRQHFGLRPSATVVLFTFDFTSGWARKNPLAVVRAFRDAVALEADVDAQLVIKVSGLTREYRGILDKELLGVDAVLINAHLSDEEMGDLFHTSDIFLSLHRAEGFGLGMAEAMSLGKTVIGTNYSGNLDFMHADNSLLVSCMQTELTQADTHANPGLERIARVGSRWAEPIHADAVRALRSAFSPELRARIGAIAMADIAANYGSVAVANKVRARLEELDRELQVYRSDWPSRHRVS